MMGSQIGAVAWYHHVRSWASWRNILLMAGLLFAYFFLLRSSVARYAFMYLYQHQTMAQIGLSVFYFGMIIISPLLALLLTYDSVAGNVERRLSNLFLSRVGRGTYLGGVLLSILGFFLEIYLIISVLLVVLTSAFLQHVSFLTFIMVFGYLLVYALSWVSIALFASVVSRRSNRSLFLSIGLYLFLFFTSLRAQSIPPADFVPSLESFSFFPDGGVLILFTVVVLFGVWRWFEVMDL